MAKEKLVDDFDFNASRETSFCESCKEGKHHRSRFPVDGGKRSSEPLGLVHSDVCVKMNAESLSGGEYFVTFIDDNTRYTWIYVLKHKDEVFPCFLEWKAQVESSTGRKLKTLRSDNGGEYVSTTGVKEKTLIEAWKGQKPNVGHLTVFGCAAYAHVGKDERQKLNVKSRKCVLLGYDTKKKGYRLYDPRRERVFNSRDVVFDESSSGIEKEQSVPERSSEQCVELDFHDDEKHVSDKEHTTEEGAEPVVRRSNREKKAPDYYGDWASVTNAELTEPTTVKDVPSNPDNSKWMSVMEKEIESLRKNDVWELVDLPKGRKAVGSKWVLNIKTDDERSVKRFKARLVAQSFSQKPSLELIMMRHFVLSPDLNQSEQLLRWRCKMI